MARAFAIVLACTVVLGSAACDTPPPDAPRVINGTEIDLQLFEELPAGESPKTTLAPDHEFSTREECAGPFIFRTEDGELYAESPRLCRGDPPFVVTSPDS